MAPPTTNAAVKQEFTICVEKPVAYNRATNEILYALGPSGGMAVIDARASSRGNGTSESGRTVG